MILNLYENDTSKLGIESRIYDFKKIFDSYVPKAFTLNFKNIFTNRIVCKS
jgi:hypothetical protein